VNKGNPPPILEAVQREEKRVVLALIKIGNGAIRLYKVTDGMGIKGIIDRTILPLLLDYLG
jgi:hypothetical protein